MHRGRGGQGRERGLGGPRVATEARGAIEPRERRAHAWTRLEGGASAFEGHAQRDVFAAVGVAVGGVGVDREGRSARRIGEGRGEAKLRRGSCGDDADPAHGRARRVHRALLAQLDEHRANADHLESIDGRAARVAREACGRVEGDRRPERGARVVDELARVVALGRAHDGEGVLRAVAVEVADDREREDEPVGGNQRSAIGGPLGEAGRRHEGRLAREAVGSCLDWSWPTRRRRPRHLGATAHAGPRTPTVYGTYG